MVVRHLDIMCITVAPPEADPVLTIDSDAVLASTLTFESFQPVSRQSAEIIQCGRSIEHAKFLKRLSGTTLEAPAIAAHMQLFGRTVRKRPDQEEL